MRRRWVTLVAILSVSLPLASCLGQPKRAPGTSGAPRISDRGPLTLKGSCSQTDDDGFREQAVLVVRNGAVSALDWRIWIAQKGSCVFDLNEFKQVRSRPHIELRARDNSACKLMVYQDPRRVTLAHAGCERMCSGTVYDQAWPVMFDPRSGRCADLSR